MAKEIPEKYKPITNELKMPGSRYYILNGIIESHQSHGKLGSLNAMYIDEIEIIMNKFAADAVACAMNNLNAGKGFSIGCYNISPVKRKKVT